jgi:imidazolonepropionase-like amidohydrolase
MKKNKHFGHRAIASVCAAAILVLSLVFAQQNDEIYIKAKKIYTSDSGRIIANGGILVKNGIIVRVDTKIKPPKNARVDDFSDKIIIPGMIDAFSHMGFYEEDYNVSTEPPNPYRAPLTGIYLIYYGQPEQPAPSPRIEARFKAAEAVCFKDVSFRRFLSEGITRAAIAIPTGGLSGGLVFVAKLGGESPSDFVMKDSVGAVFNISVEGDVMRRHGDLKKIFQDALDYRKTWDKYSKDLKKYQDQEKNTGETHEKEVQEPKKPRKNENHEAILQVLDQKIPALIRASRENEIQAALKIQDEFKVRLVLIGGQEAYKIPKDLSSRKICVIAGPDVVLDKKGTKINYLKELLTSGVPVAFCSDSSVGASFIPYQLAVAVQHGMSRVQALDTVTARAAEIFSLSDKVGSIAAGREADFVVLDGEPFDLSTKVMWVYVGGQRFFSEE